MNITSAIDSSAFFIFNFIMKKITIEGSGESELISSTITTTTTTLASTTNIVLRLFNTTTRIFSLPRPTGIPPASPTSSPLSNKYFLFNSSFNRTLRELEN